MRVTRLAPNNTIEVIPMADDKQAPVSTPVEPKTTRRGRRAMEKVAAEAALGQVRTTNKANDAKANARTKTAVLTEAEKQQAITDRQQAAATKRRKERNAARWVDFKFKLGRATQTAMIVGPITAPMSIAWTGQIGFAQGILKWPFAGGVMYAAAYELSIIFCAWMYHEARKDGDSGAYYRMLTWAFAIANGVQQWWHWSDDWKATPRSVTYSIMTAVGILIWEAYAKLIHRRKLRADGKLSGARPRIGLARWMRYTRISWTAWSGSVRHGFDNFQDMWTWAEVEVDRKTSDRSKTADLKRKLKEANARVSDLEKIDRKLIKGKVERTDQQPDPKQIEPDLLPATLDPEPINPGPLPQMKEIEAGPQPADPGPESGEFAPTAAEKQAIDEMIERGIRINRTEVANYIRENRVDLGQPEGIATKRAAEVAAWGKWHGKQAG